MTSFFDENNKNERMKKKKSGWNASVEQSMNTAIKIQITLSIVRMLQHETLL